MGSRLHVEGMPPVFVFPWSTHCTMLNTFMTPDALKNEMAEVFYGVLAIHHVITWLNFNEVLSLYGTCAIMSVLIRDVNRNAKLESLSRTPLYDLRPYRFLFKLQQSVGAQPPPPHIRARLPKPSRAPPRPSAARHRTRRSRSRPASPSPTRNLNRQQQAVAARLPRQPIPRGSVAGVPTRPPGHWGPPIPGKVERGVYQHFLSPLDVLTCFPDGFTQESIPVGVWARGSSSPS